MLICVFSVFEGIAERFMKKSEIKPADSCFIKAGGVWQPRVSDAQDMLSLLELDDALWQCTSLPLDALRCDPELLNILDLDKNHQIRTDEIKSIISWAAENFCSLEGFESRSEVLKLSDISDESEDGKKIREAGQTVLQALGRNEEVISLQELLDDQQIRSCAGSNGDGIIVPDMEKYPDESRLIEEIIRVTGGSADLSGQTGINSSQLADFCQQAEQAAAWFAVDRQGGINLLPYGDETMLLLGLHTDLAPAINGYFQSAGAMKFLQNDPERIKNKKLSADLRSLSEVEELLGNMTFAAPAERMNRCRCLQWNWQNSILLKSISA